MELLPLLFMSSCFLTLSGLTVGDQSGKSVTKVTVKEDAEAILPCSLGTNENIESKMFVWKKEGTDHVFLYNPDSNPPSNPGDQFKGRVSHFPGELEHGNASIKIIKTRVEDKGTYSCFLLDSETKFYVELAVERILKVQNIPGVAQPFVIIPDRTNDWALLRCDVKNAYPKPTVEWRNSNNEIIHSEEPQVSEVGGRFYITVETNVTKDDRYLCVAKQENISHQAHTEISVELNGKPVIVKDGDDAILPCSLGTNENIEFMRFEWTKEGTEKKVYIRDTGMGYSPALPGRVSHFPDDLQHGSASIRIYNVQLEDGGIYTCDFPSRGKTFRIKLVVGAAEPEITIFVQRNGGVLLQCDVQSGLPKPTVEWWDSNNQIISSEEPQVSTQGDRFNITLKATVKKTGRYRCVTTQEEINHQAQKEINVHLNVSGFPVWAAILSVTILGVIVGGIILAAYCWKKGSRRRENGCSTPLQAVPTSERP